MGETTEPSEPIGEQKRKCLLYGLFADFSFKPIFISASIYFVYKIRSLASETNQ